MDYLLTYKQSTIYKNQSGQFRPLLKQNNMKKFFLVKSKIEGLNEKGKVVKLSEQNLVEALDVKDAEHNFRTVTKGTGLEGCDITSISETKIVDVYRD